MKDRIRRFLISFVGKREISALLTSVMVIAVAYNMSAEVMAESLPADTRCNLQKKVYDGDITWSDYFPGIDNPGCGCFTFTPSSNLFQADVCCFWTCGNHAPLISSLPDESRVLFITQERYKIEHTGDCCQYCGWKNPISSGCDETLHLMIKRIDEDGKCWYGVYDENRALTGYHNNINKSDACLTGEGSDAAEAGKVYHVNDGKWTLCAISNSGVNPDIDQDPISLPSANSESVGQTVQDRTDLEVREALEEGMTVSPVAVDMTNINRADLAALSGTTYNLSNFVTTKGIVKGINVAVAASNKSGSNTVAVYSQKPLCFNGEIIKAIRDGKKDLIYYYLYKGHLYSVTIPAGVDDKVILEKSGFAGPLYIGHKLGTTQVVK